MDRGGCKGQVQPRQAGQVPAGDPVLAGRPRPRVRALDQGRGQVLTVRVAR